MVSATAVRAGDRGQRAVLRGAGLEGDPGRADVGGLEAPVVVVLVEGDEARVA
jgi:hypothetical protein